MLFYFFSVHSHYDMSDEGVLEKAHSAVKEMVEKYAKAAVEHPGSGADTAEQITLLTKTFKKFVKTILIYKMKSLCQTVWGEKLFSL